LILTSFISVPVILSTFLLFYGLWASNDYFVFERSLNMKSTLEDNVDGYNVLPDEYQETNLMNVEIGKQSFCTSLKNVLSCRYKAKTSKDSTANGKISYIMMI
jgi:hypothetical protein